MKKGRRVFKLWEFLDVLSESGYDSRMIVKMWFYWHYKTATTILKGVIMKVVLAFLFLLCMTTKAHALVGSGDLVLSGSYLDDVPNTQVAPQASLVLGQALTPSWALSEVLTAGNISQLDGSSGLYGRVGGDVWYAGFSKDLKVGVGGALESSKQIYRSYGDYVHMNVAYKLW